MPLIQFQISQHCPSQGGKHVQGRMMQQPIRIHDFESEIVVRPLFEGRSRAFVKCFVRLKFLFNDFGTIPQIQSHMNMRLLLMSLLVIVCSLDNKHTRFSCQFLLNVFELLYNRSREDSSTRLITNNVWRIRC